MRASFLLLVCASGLATTACRQEEPAVLETVVINEAARTLLYLPLYHAIDKGYFRARGIDAHIVTGGTATAAMASLLSGEAHFAQADPMYVPISRQQGGETVVVAQVVGRVALWAVTIDTALHELTARSLRGKTIATHTRPMSAFTYTTNLLRQFGLRDGRDVTVLQGAPGSELPALLSNRAAIAVTVMPAVEQAVSQGGRVVLSFPRLLGDRVFSGVMTTLSYIRADTSRTRRVIEAYQAALDDLHANPDSGLATAVKYFPNVDRAILRASLLRMLQDSVIPASVLMSEESWSRAMQVRVEAGDIPSTSPRDSNIAAALLSVGRQSR